MRNLRFEKEAWEDIMWLQKNDSKAAIKLFELIQGIVATPFEGIGKPEPLKHNLTGYWGRRITKEHRLVYKVEGNIIIIAGAKGHY